MHDTLTFLYFVAVVVISAVAIYSIFLKPKGKHESWSERYDREWFESNKYCPVCGRELGWYPEHTYETLPNTHFESDTGRQFNKTVWSCPKDQTETWAHTHFGMIDRCIRKEYV